MDLAELEEKKKTQKIIFPMSGPYACVLVSTNQLKNR